MATTLYAYRGRNDDGNETTATWKAAQNVPWAQARDTNFRIRFAVQNDTSAINNLDVKLQYSLNDSSWTDVTAASNVVRSSASANLADAANLTTQLTGGTGTFIGATAFDEVNGICGGTSLDLTATGNMETEFCVQLRSADVASGTTVYLRTINSDTGTAWTSYSAGSATMYADWLAKTAVPGADALGGYADSLGVTLTAGRAGWEDSIAAVVAATVALSASLTADSLNNFADPLTRLIGDHLVTFPDDFNQWSDQFSIVLTTQAVPLSANLPADSAANLNDLVSPFFTIAFRGTDDANNWADALAANQFAQIAANPAADAMVMTDSVVALRRLLAALPADSAANLADILNARVGIVAQVSDAMGNFNDSTNAVETLQANLAADSLNNLADSSAQLRGLLVRQSDDAANLSDALNTLLTGMAALSVQLSDSALNLADGLAGSMTLGALLVDSAANLNDPALRLVGDHYLNFSDALNSWSDTLGISQATFIALSINLPPDNLNNWNDSPAGLLRLNFSQADTWGNLLDSVSSNLAAGRQGWADELAAAVSTSVALSVNITDAWGTLNDSISELIGEHLLEFLDDLNLWSDQVALNLSGPATIIVGLSDSAANLNDLLGPELRLFAGLSDSGPSLADSLARLEGLVVSPTADAMAMTETLAGLRALLVRQSDDAANLSDAVATFMTAGAALTASFSDNANNWNDTLTGRRELLAAFVDSAANLNDMLNAFAAGFGQLMVSLLDSMAMADALTGRHAMFAGLSDDAANLNDSSAGLRRMSANLSADSWGNLADTLEGSRGLLANQTDSAANLADSATLRQAIAAQLLDDAANLADSLAGFQRLFANPGADAWGNIADSISASTGAQLFINLVDAMGNLADTLAGARALLADSTDSAANVDDSLAMQADIAAQMIDAAGNLADTLGGFREIFANLDPDSAALLSDLIAGGLGSLLAPDIYKLTELLTEFALTEMLTIYRLKELPTEYELREAA